MSVLFICGLWALAVTPAAAQGEPVPSTQPGTQPATQPAPRPATQPTTTQVARDQQQEAQLRQETAAEAQQKAAAELEQVREQLEKTERQASARPQSQSIAAQRQQLEQAAAQAERGKNIAELRQAYAEKLAATSARNLAIDALARELEVEVSADALEALSRAARAELLARLVADAAAQRDISRELRDEGDRIAGQVADVQTHQLTLKKQRDETSAPAELERISTSLEQIERLIDQRRLLGYEIARQARAENRLAYEYEQAAEAVRAYENRFWVQNRWLIDVGRVLAIALLATLATHLLCGVITLLVGIAMHRLRHGVALPTIKRTQTLVQFARSIALLVIWVAATVSVLGEFGVSPGQSAGALGVIGLVLAGMFQQLVVDFVKGIDIAIGGHYFVGDFIQVSGHSGHVLDFTVKYTVLRTPSGQVITLPNSQCVPSRRFPAGYVDNYIDITLARPADLVRARELIADLSRVMNRRIEAIKQGPQIEREFIEGGASILRVLVRVLPTCDWVITERFVPEVKRVLAAANIELVGEPTFFYLNDVRTFRRLFSRQMTDKDMAAAKDADLRPTIERDAMPDMETELAEAQAPPSQTPDAAPEREL